MLTLWRDLHALEVPPRDMADAIALAQFYLTETSRQASAATVSAEIDRAEILRKWLLENWWEPDVLMRDVLQFGPGALREGCGPGGGAGAKMSFPREHWAAIASTNPLERGDREVKRRADIIAIFPNGDAIIRLVGALMLESNDECR